MILVILLLKLGHQGNVIWFKCNVYVYRMITFLVMIHIKKYLCIVCNVMEWNTYIYIYICLWLSTAAVTSLSTGTQREIKNAKLEEPLTLKCTYNCSSGFTRGYWEATPLCSKCEWIKEFSKSGEMCIASLYTPHLMLQQTRYNYSCVSEESDRPGLPRKTELLVTLTVQGKSYVLSFTVMMTNYFNNRLYIIVI